MSSTISGTVGVVGVDINYSGQASGSVTSGAGGSYSISGLADGSYVISPVLSGYEFTPVSRSVVVSGSDVPGVDFQDFHGHYSVPDDRDYSVFPNDADNIQGTGTYVVPANPSHSKPVDSRVNVPVDSRTSPNIPENSRTSPPFES